MTAIRIIECDCTEITAKAPDEEMARQVYPNDATCQNFGVEVTNEVYTA